MPAQNTRPSDYPQAVVQQIALLAQNIVIARKRRKETQAQWAKKLGVSQPTMARIESGDPSVAMASYVMCIWLISPSATLADLIAPQQDQAALEREIVRIQSRGTRVALGSAIKDIGIGAALTTRIGATQTASGLAALIAAQGLGKPK
ncbi:helix-turn-helix transcriptional regulator [Rhodoferax saidenbachensis]|uniref:Transcriptional regulator n=1 Tax=Rhodoferax saidenbachensis TaxID=1484693 RepID=A0A1P8KEX0_9BURK|nr:transcriptional regulator [Rhodoferax saidenbachensis]APW44532.1 transcriptional regulator [Rhodoferax saidenbachensis]